MTIVRAIALVMILVVGLGCRTASPTVAYEPPPSVSPCGADPNHHRLDFWLGEWDVFDSVGVRYAKQRVYAAADRCAVVAEWAGPVGDKGLGISALDGKTGEWRQVYVSNQVPTRAGVVIRRSDPAYSGPGVRFIPLDPPASAAELQTRMTIEPSPGGRAVQLFETSGDGGLTWNVVFRAEHRHRQRSSAAPNSRSTDK